MAYTVKNWIPLHGVGSNLSSSPQNNLHPHSSASSFLTQLPILTQSKPSKLFPQKSTNSITALFSNLNNKTDENAHWCRKICKYNYFLPIQSHYFNVLSAAKRIQSLRGKWISHCQHPLKGCATYTHCNPKVTQGKSKGPTENQRNSSNYFWASAKEKAMDWASHSLGLKKTMGRELYISQTNTIHQVL